MCLLTILPLLKRNREDILDAATRKKKRGIMGGDKEGENQRAVGEELVQNGALYVMRRENPCILFYSLPNSQTGERRLFCEKWRNFQENFILKKNLSSNNINFLNNLAYYQLRVRDR
jgi:hypothetical protein